ncbi:hypothetical protein, partial [Escherichia coli]|uniref:hypothetical protein n=1 Tax=Escherichia coli TaxID=562 RepID=UPI0032B5B4E2
GITIDDCWKGWAILLRQKQKKLIMLPSETMIWQPEFTDKTLSRKPGAVQTDAKNDNLFYLINATCHKFTGKADHLILLQNTKVVKIAVGSLRL